MKYMLMQKNYEVANIEIDEDDGRITAIGEVLCVNRMPVGIEIKNGVPDILGLKAWWSHRGVPISRSGINKVLETLKIRTTQELLVKCMGLSLSDQYWVRPANSNLKWEDINFFDNDFSEDVGNILFGEKPRSDSINMMSPDCSSDGWLKKKWKIINGKRCLVKGGSSFFQEPFNEVIASRIAERLGLFHVDYFLDFEGKNHSPVCICEDFVTRDTELISAGSINRILPVKDGDNKYEHFIKCCEFLKIPDFQKSLDEMLILDYIIANQDRHMGNFGVLRNVDTLEYIGFAPIFDCGTSLRYDTPTVYIEPELNIESQPFASFHDEQIRLVSDPQAFDLSRLDGAVEEIMQLFASEKATAYMDDARQKKILSVLSFRIKKLEQLFSQEFGFENTEDLNKEQGEEQSMNM